MMRGVILGPTFELDQARATFDSGVDPLLLRQCLLFWDMIDWPVLRGPSLAPPHGTDILISEGILQSSTHEYAAPRTSGFSYTLRDVQVTVRGHADAMHQVVFGEREDGGGYTMNEMAFKAQALAFEHNNGNGSGLWSLAQPNPFLVLPVDTAARTIEVQLYRSVPVPAADVPLEAVLNLKRRRNAELLAYRGAIDDLYQEVIRSGDIPHATARATARLQTAVLDMHQVMKDANMKRARVSAKIEFNPAMIGDAITRVSALGAAGYQLGFAEAAIAAGIGLVSAAIKIQVQRVPKLPNIPPELASYAYLSTIERSLGSAHVGRHQSPERGSHRRQR